MRERDIYVKGELPVSRSLVSSRFSAIVFI